MLNAAPRGRLHSPGMCDARRRASGGPLCERQLVPRDAESPLTERTVILLSKEMVAQIDAFRRRGDSIPSRGAAIRQRVELGLKAATERRPSKT